MKLSERKGIISIVEAAPQTKQDITERISRSRNDIRALGVKKLGLFGSFVREDQETGSDVDLLVEFEPDAKTFDNFMTLSFLLEDVLQHRIELVTIESLSPYIGPQVLEEMEHVLLFD